MQLDVTDLNKSYPTPGGSLDILSNVTFSLLPGDAAAITGPSGTGKSTLLYLLGGLETPTRGVITLGGKRVEKSDVGFVFQDHCLLPQCSVLENILIPTFVAPAQDCEKRARALVEQVGLTGRVDHRPAQLSGGEKQRVAIARALIRHPHLLLCDEPTGNLDETTADGVASLLLDLHHQQKNILVVVTHSPRLAARFPIRFQLSGMHLTREG
jgi:lipoprotein-releasing system ATP-binding protein